jgi:hypothetical protein
LLETYGMNGVQGEAEDRLLAVWGGYTMFCLCKASLYHAV